MAADPAIERPLTHRYTADHGDQPPAVLELRDERTRYDLDRALDEDRVIRCGLRPAGGELPGRDRRIGEAELRKRLARLAGERRIFLERDDAAGKFAQHRAPIAGGAADLAHAIVLSAL